MGLQWSNVEDDTPINEDSGILRGNRGMEYYDTWVTLFGFSAEDLPAVLREFLTCGDIVTYDTSERGPAGNWVHVQYRVSLCLCPGHDVCCVASLKGNFQQECNSGMKKCLVNPDKVFLVF